MEESTLIKAEDDCSVFVDSWEDGGVWLSIQTRRGGANCVVPVDQIPAMIAALQQILEKHE